MTEEINRAFSFDRQLLQNGPITLYFQQRMCDLPKVLAASDTIWVKRT